jgi:hypothetical protein
MPGHFWVSDDLFEKLEKLSEKYGCSKEELLNKLTDKALRELPSIRDYYKYAVRRNR